MKCSAPSLHRHRSTPQTSMPFVGPSSLASLSLGIRLLALALPSGPSSLVVSAQPANNTRNGFEYSLVHGHQSWTVHEEMAVAWGGHLASVHSQEEYDFILSLRDPELNHKYFLGGMRIRTSKGNETWAWSDGSTWNYTAWADSEPSNLNGLEDRMEILKSGTKNKWSSCWNDVESTSLRPAIYKRRIGPSPAPTASPAPNNNVYHGFEYSIIPNDQNWEVHEQDAVAWGGHLASVHSLGEYDFILSLRVPDPSNHKYFLGGKRIRGGDTWAWSDGSPWNYTAWAKSEPSNSNNIEDRVEILKRGTDAPRHSLWNDIENTSLRPAIYKRRVATSAAPSSGPPTTAPVTTIRTPSPVVGPTSAAPSSVLRPPTASPVAVLPTPSTVSPVFSAMPASTGTRSSSVNSGISGWLIFLYILLALILYWAFVFPGYKTIIAYLQMITTNETRHDSNTQRSLQEVPPVFPGETNNLVPSNDVASNISSQQNTPLLEEASNISSNQHTPLLEEAGSFSSDQNAQLQSARTKFQSARWSEGSI